MVYKHYNVWYKKYGIRKVKDFVSLKSLATSDFYYPRYSMVHFITSDKSLLPNRTFPLFKNIVDGVIVNMLYWTVDTKLISKKVNESTVINKLSKVSKDFDYYKKDKFDHYFKTKETFAKNNVLIVNYNSIRDHYRIVSRWDTNLVLYRNDYSTVVDTILYYINMVRKYDMPIMHYLPIELPNSFPKYQKFHRFIDKELNRQALELFYTEDRLVFFDIMRVVDKISASLTPYKDIVDIENVVRHITLLFYNNEKVIIVNLEKYLSFSKAYRYESSKKFDPIRYMRLIYFMYKFAKILPAHSLEEIESGSYNDENIKIIKNTFGNNSSELGFGIIDGTSIDNKTEINIEKLEELEESEPEVNNIEDEEDIVETLEEKIMLEDNNERILDTLELESETEDFDKLYNTIKDVMDTKADLDKDIEKRIEIIADSYGLNPAQKKRAIATVNKLLNSESPYKDGKKIRDLLKITKDEIEIKKEEKKLPADPKVVFDKRDLEDTIGAIDKKYLEEIYEKDMISSTLAIQKAGLVVDDYKIEKTDYVLGEYETHTLKVKDIKGSSYIISFKLPVVDKNGIFKMSGNQYRLRKQRVDVPIKKISPKRVALSSAYGKLFVDKAPYKKQDAGFDIKKKLLKLQEDGKVKNIVMGLHQVADIKLPIDYSLFMRYIKSFVIGKYEFMFDYEFREDILDKKYDINIVENNGKYVVVGRDKQKHPLVMDYNNIIYVYDNGYKKIGTILDILGISKNDIKHEYALIKVYGTYIPLVILLSYYLGFDKLAKMLNVKVEKLEGSKRVEPKDHQYVLKTSDKTVILTMPDAKSEMIFYGLEEYKKYLRELPYDNLNSKDDMLALFSDVKLTLNVITEIKLLEPLFIDPVTANILEIMGEPTKFPGLLIRAAELLIDDYYIHPNNLEGYLIKGYERIPQIVYKTLVDSIRKKESEEFFGKSRLMYNPYEAWSIINADSTGVLVDDINPIAYLKQKEDTTATGIFGRNKESMPKATRELRPDAIGVISEATKDSSDAGITAYLSANPVIKNVRGLKDKVDPKNLANSNIFSTSAMMAPFSIKDDSKRVNFINIQNQHIIPIKNAIVYPVRTGYEAVFPYKLDKRFIAFAEEDGIVINVFKNKIVVEYGKRKITYNYRDWTSKEESHTSWLHILVPNVKEGQKVRKGDVLYYDKSFFEPDMFDRTKVVYRAHLMARTATIESSETYEDASSISRELATKAGISYVKSRSIIVEASDIIKNYKKIGDMVNPNDALFTISKGVLTDTAGLDQESIDILEGFVRTTPKAKAKGEIIDIKVFYNCDKEELSDSLKELVELAEKNMVDPITNKKYNGRVDSSYSIEGKPLDNGKVEIKYYIKVEEVMGLGDKCIFANSNKSVVSEVFDYPVISEDGRKIDAFFSNRGIAARIVTSPYLMGTTAGLLRILTENVVKMYFGDNVEIGNESKDYNINILTSKDFIDKPEYIYHIGKAGYDSIKSPGLIDCNVNSSLDICKRIKEYDWYYSIDDNLYSVSFFIGRPTYNDLSILKKAGFIHYQKLDDLWLYLINIVDNKSKVDGKITIRSTPAEIEFSKKYWDAIYKSITNSVSKDIGISAYDLLNDNIPEDKELEVYKLYIKYKNELFIPRLREYCKKVYGYDIFNMSVSDYMNFIVNTDFKDFTKYVKINSREGNKNQYASYIPHIVMSGIKQPIDIKDEARLKDVK